MGRINTALITLFGQDINKGDGSRQIGNAVVGGSAATAVTLPYRSHFARQKAARLSLAAVGFLRYGKASLTAPDAAEPLYYAARRFDVEPAR